MITRPKPSVVDWLLASEEPWTHYQEMVMGLSSQADDNGRYMAGHFVRLDPHQDFEALVNSHGLAFWPARVMQDVIQ